MNKEIWEELQKIIRDYKGDENLLIEKDSSLINDLGLSSLDIINLVGIIEDTFDIEVDDSDLATMATVKDVADYVCKKKAEK